MPVGLIQHFSLPNLTEVRGDIFFDTFSNEVESITLKKLTTVTGTLYIYNTDEETSDYLTLTELSFPSLSSVGKIDIQYNGGLRNYQTFGPLFVNNKLSEGQWNTWGNGYDPTWVDMKNGDYVK